MSSPARNLALSVGASRFDGNLSDNPSDWWFITGLAYEAEDVAASIDALMLKAAEGMFSWVVFPLDGFRLYDPAHGHEGPDPG